MPMGNLILWRFFMLTASRKLLCSLALSALFAAACGGSSDSSSADASASDEDTGSSESGGSSDAAAGLPTGCDNSTPLQVSVDGVAELTGDFAVAGGVALPFAILPGDGPLIDLSEDELAAAVDASDLRGYTLAVTDFPYGPDDAGEFYGLFSSPTLPDTTP